MTIELCGARVYYEQHGTGRDVLLLHGWGGKTESWAPVLRDFSDCLRMTVLDFPGHARSSDPPEPWSVDEYAAMVIALMDALGIERADLVAHSFGGRVALVLASRWPRRVNKMVLTGVPGLKSTRAAARTLRTRVYKALRTALCNRVTSALFTAGRVDLWREALVQRFGSADYRALSADMRRTFSRIVSQDLTPCLEQIKAPTLLFWGETDTAAPLWMGQRMQQDISDAGLVVMQGSGHFAYLDRYADFSAVMKNFLG